MKHLLLSALLVTTLLNAQDTVSVEDGFPEDEILSSKNSELLLQANKPLRVSVTAQGVAPANTISPAQAYVMAKRAATVEAYRLIAERINGVRVEGKDTIKNMVVQRSTVKSQVSALIKNATIVETTFKNGLCEVEMEVELNFEQFK